MKIIYDLYLKRAMFLLEYIVLRVFCGYKLWYT